MSDVAMTAEDRLAVLELFAGYAWAFDKHDAAAYAELFVKDGVVDGQDGQIHRGREAIQNMVQFHIDRRPPGLCMQHHNDHLRFVEGDGKSCVVYSYFAVIRIDRTHSSPRTDVLMGGQYRSHCVKENGRWYFKERQIRDWNADGLPWKK